jgi:hypothetical protein
MGESKMPKFFSLDEANAALLVIKPMLADIMRIRQNVLARQPEIWPVIQKAAGNGGSKAASLIALEFGQLDDSVHRILDMGVIVKDLDIGLLDFPALMNKHEVYLCWKFGEENVLFWHEIDDGFAGRQPLKP